VLPLEQLSVSRAVVRPRRRRRHSTRRRTRTRRGSRLTHHRASQHSASRREPIH
jgi:hypothetical protein